MTRITSYNVCYTKLCTPVIVKWVEFSIPLEADTTIICAETPGAIIWVVARIKWELSLAILFLIAGTATAGYVSYENPATDTGLKQVPYNINGVFTTVSGVTYDSASEGFAADNSGIVYTVTQYDRLFTVTEDSYNFV